jgi:hypothetical protein
MDIECFNCHELVSEDEHIAGCCFSCYYGEDNAQELTYEDLEQKIIEQAKEIKKYHQIVSEYQLENYRLYNELTHYKERANNQFNMNDLFANMVIIKPEDEGIDISSEKKYNTTREENVIYYDFGNQVDE